MSREKMLYKDHSSMEGMVCLYCKNYADEIDHYPPVSMARHFKHWEYGFRIRCCRTCNWNLGDSVQGSLEERVEAALLDLPTKRIPPRFKSKEEKDRYLRIERVMLAIARRQPLPDPDALLKELKGGKDGSGD